jgi:hypothetical protein
VLHLKSGRNVQRSAFCLLFTFSSYYVLHAVLCVLNPVFYLHACMMSGNGVIRWMTWNMLHKESSLTDVVTYLRSAELRDGYLCQTSTVCLYRFIGDCIPIPQQPNIHRHIHGLSTLVEVTNKTLCTTFVQLECLKTRGTSCGSGSRLSARWWRSILFSPVNIMLAMLHYFSSVCLRGQMRGPLEAQTH